MNWGELIRHAAALNLPPDRFWRLSMKEWRALTGPSGPAPLSRAEFEALIATHPDRP